MVKFVRHLSLDKILNHKKVFKIYLQIQCLSLYSDIVSAPDNIWEYAEQLTQWFSDEFELRRPGEVSIQMSLYHFTNLA